MGIISPKAEKDGIHIPEKAEMDGAQFPPRLKWVRCTFPKTEMDGVNFAQYWIISGHPEIASDLGGMALGLI
jgi:hypothetical protein